MTAASNEVVAVIQADRDMVQAFHRLRLNKLMEAIKDEKAGARLGEDEGDAGDLVQAFARHRIAHSDPRPVAEGLREALSNCVNVLCSLRKNYERDNLLWDEASRFITEGNAALATHSPAPMAGEAKQIADNLTPNQRLIVQERDYEIGNRRARTLARNYVRALRLIWSDGLGLTPLGEQVRAYLTALATHSPAPMAGEGFQWPDEAVCNAQTEQERMATVKAYTAHKRTGHPSTQEGGDRG